ncbi:Hsc70-interacting protein (Hip), putative [Trypanosoma brucei gambiense DAL972]|uniref:Hsc70-interacting protein (Hip), putative n=1 Tax=Trypanosoma brucei gambiense (strain MHOM/CI/86/DAL972) TaxID=679716 RepID=C9ZKP5_TRYB9|nr:Hsc70-interacting protein (Hip), putative [Trypanosoma brucei gambiense DAL972]CBH10261.1 Hsc70-interacting protein (Hip), putative [Trypanosoma brucei gambiense DAL972]|eukprot:XP_011772551.1 Hsc70-interacting protein (Hip), putative [Trypanosoma brucei gambiense DAL972]
MHTLSSCDFEALNRVLDFLRLHPSEIHRDEFNGLRAFLTSLGATLPPSTYEPKTTAGPEANEEDTASEPDEELWKLEDVADDGIPAGSGDPSPEQEEKAMELKAAAADCAADGRLDEAVDLLAQALRLVPGKAMYWSQRASYLLECKRPGAALRDANRALSLNPENVRALRVRGTVNRHLGKWEDALKDLSEAQTVDYDEKADALLRLVQEKANARRQSRRRKEEEREAKRQEALRRQREMEMQREEEEERRQNQRQAPPSGGFPGGFPGGMPGGFPGGMSGGMEEIMKDPEILEAMRNPEIASKFSTLMQNPMAALGMMSDPQMGPLLQKVMSKVMGGGFPGAGMPGSGFPGGGMSGQGFASSPDATPGTTNSAPPKGPLHDPDELD